MVKITKVVQRNAFDSVVEVTLTVTTVIREGRDVPEMSFEGHQIEDEAFIEAVHYALDSDPITEEEMNRICG
jgi:hypothetical protein